MRVALLLAGVMLLAAPGAGCGDDDGGSTGAQTATTATAPAGPPPPPGRVLVRRADFPSALAALPDGGLLYTELRSGRIRELSAQGRLADEPVAEVDVATGGQRGLVGVAVDQEERVFASYMRASDRRLVVAQVAPGRERVIWEGPPSTDLATGGRIAFAPDNQLTIGIGDLQAPQRTPDPNTPNGKLLALDPEGEATQKPIPLSSGWNNPFAFAWAGPKLWVADNAPGTRPERIGEGNRGSEPAMVTDLARKTIPTGLAAGGPRELYLCGLGMRTLERFEVGRDGRVPATGEPVAGDCTLAVAVLSDGRIATASETTIRVVSP